MDAQVISRIHERAFAGDLTARPVTFSFNQIRYSRDSKQRDRESESQPIRSLQQMVDREDEREEDEPGPSGACLAGYRGKRPLTVDQSHSESGINRYTLRTDRQTVGEAISTQSLSQESTKTRTISISVDQQPPHEIRPSHRLPPIVVNIRRLRHQSRGAWMGEEGSLWAQVSLMSADGQMAMALFAPDILAAEDMVTPLFRESSVAPTEENWSLEFGDLRIRRPGNFKIHIAVLRSSQSEERGDEDPAVEPPRELMGVDTQVIRVHAFAPSLARTGER